jgi:hypothetical protein
MLLLLFIYLFLLSEQIERTDGGMIGIIAYAYFTVGRGKGKGKGKGKAIPLQA